jgi:hypothetical protein
MTSATICQAMSWMTRVATILYYNVARQSRRRRFRGIFDLAVVEAEAFGSRREDHRSKGSIAVACEPLRAV